MSKKYFIMPVALILVATILMVPMSNATTTYVNNVLSSYGTSNSVDNIKGTVPDGAYVIFDGAGSKIILEMNTASGSSSMTLNVYAKANSGTPVLKAYSGTDNPPTAPSSSNSKTIGSNWGWYTFDIPKGHKFIGLSNEGGSLYIDVVTLSY